MEACLCYSIFISFYFDRLKYFCESKPDRDKKWQKAIVVPYLDATKFLRGKTTHTILVLQESKPEVHGLDQKASQEEFQVERMYQSVLKSF